MKVKVNLSNQTLEYMDSQPYIQGTDTRNKLDVYIEHSSVPQTEGAFNIMIAYALQNGRTTIKMANTGATQETIDDVLYDIFYFVAPKVLTSISGNFVATLILKVNTNTYKVNVLNTVLNAVDFEAFEDALDDTASEVLESLESMSENITYLQSQVVGVLHNTDIVDNDDSNDPTKVLSARMGKVLAERIGATTSGLVSATYNESTGVLTLTYENNDTYEMKIGLDATDIQAMSDDVLNDVNDDLTLYKNQVNQSLEDMTETIQGLGQLQPSGTTTSTNLPTSNQGILIATDNGHWYYWNGTQYADGGVYQATQVSDVNILELDEDLQDAFNVTFKDASITEYQKHSGSKFIYNAQYNLLAEQSNQHFDCIVYQVEANKIYKIKADAIAQSVIYCFCNSIPTTSTTATPLTSDFVANISSDQYLEYVVKAPANCYLLMSVRKGTTNYGVFEIDNIRAKVDGIIPLSAIDTAQEILKENLVPLSTSNVNSYLYTTDGTKDSSSTQFKSVDTEVIENAIKIKIKKGVGVYGGAFLDENKVWISSFSSATVGTEYNIPTNCKYVNITVNMSTADNRFSFIVQTYKITNLETDYNADFIPSVWKDKKILCLGTSVSFGSGATENYIHYASEKLGFNLINTSVPGEAIHTNSDGSPLTYGSTSLSISEYASYGITIASEPILPIVPNGNYNNYYRTWEHIFNAENNDADLYVYDVVPNNGNFDLTDWNNFNKSTWSYTTGTFADHRTTFLGALLYLMDKMYEINPNARMVFVLSSNFAYTNGKQAFETIANYYKIPIIDLWSKINTSPKSIIKINQDDGSNQHPTTFAHEIMGKMFIGELMKIA